jgi:hypothetical protein
MEIDKQHGHGHTVQHRRGLAAWIFTCSMDLICNINMDTKWNLKCSMSVFMSMDMQHVHVHVHRNAEWTNKYMLNVHDLVYGMSMLMLHITVHAMCRCPCCMSQYILNVYVHAEYPWTCCMSMDMLNVRAMLHGHGHAA